MMPTHDSNPRRVAFPPSVPELIYDGECPWCSKWAWSWSRRYPRGVTLKPLQDAGARYPEIAERLPKAIHFVEVNGRVSSGVEALLRARRAAGGTAWPLRVYERCAWCRWIMDKIYRFVARHRPRKPS